MKIMEQDPAYSFYGMISRVFFDSWIAMLASGALGHQLHIAILVKLSYWQFVLICIALQSLWPITHVGKWRIKDK